MKITNVHVWYTDGTEEDYVNFTAAQEGIRETVAGCDFVATVHEVVATMEDGTEYDLYCKWDVSFEVQVPGYGLRPAGVLDGIPK